MTKQELHGLHQIPGIHIRKVLVRFGVLFKRIPLLQEHWAIKEELKSQRRAQTRTAGPGLAPRGDIRGQQSCLVALLSKHYHLRNFQILLRSTSVISDMEAYLN